MKVAPQYAKPQLRQRAGDWCEYERRKRQWLRDNPDATPEQYTRAVRKIADECGV